MRQVAQKGPDHERTRAVGVGAVETAADAAGTGVGPVIHPTEPAGAAAQPSPAGNAGSGGGSGGSESRDAAGGPASREGAPFHSLGADSTRHPASVTHRPEQRPAYRHVANARDGA